MESYFLVGAEYNMRPGASPFSTPENLWKALTEARAYRLGMARAEEDAKTGTIRLINEDAIKG